MPNNIIEQIINQDEDTDTDTNSVFLLPPPTEPMAVARVFVNSGFLHSGKLTLRYWRGGWWLWRTTHWVEVHERGIRSLVYKFTEHAKCLTLTGGGQNRQRTEVNWSPTRNKVTDVVDALSSICILPNELDQPCWLDERTTGVIVAVANGLLDIGHRQLLPHTPDYFNQTSVPFNYDRNAPVPTKWNAFLNELWPQQQDAIACLGEWFGYVISGHTYLHKIGLIVGPTRGGKGAIGRVLGALVGRKNVAPPEAEQRISTISF
jgi:putative DNA primase/helicase